LKSNYKNEPAVLVDKSSSSIWERGRDLLSRQQEKLFTLLSNKEKKKRKQDLHSAATAAGGNVFDTLKRYFNSSTPSFAFPITQQEESNITFSSCSSVQEEDEDEEMLEAESNTSTPKLSLDCSSVEDEDEAQEQEYFLINDRLEQEQKKERTEQQKDDSEPFIYIPHTDMSTAIATPTTCKRRHHSFDSSSMKPTIVEEEEVCHNKKRRRSSYDIELLNSTITRGSARLSSDKEEKEEDFVKRRIDFVLQPEKLFFGCLPKNEYVSGLTAHFSYWTHKDLMWHIVRRLENTSSSSL
jgi:hypothetical protein